MKLRIKDLNAQAVQRAINKDMETYSGKTIWEALSLLQTATGVRYDDLVLPSKKPKKMPPVYSTDDIAKLIVELSIIGGEVEVAGLLALWLSLRRSEIMGLKWEDIRPDAVIVRSARVYNKKHKLVEKDTKNSYSTRIIPCDSYILDRINALPKYEDEPYIFTMSTSGIWKGISTACINAGIQHGYLHGLRHTNATIMEYLGIPGVYANKRGGWSKDHTRIRTYTDAMSEGELEAALKVDTFYLDLIELGEIGNEFGNDQN